MKNMKSKLFFLFILMIPGISTRLASSQSCGEYPISLDSFKISEPGLIGTSGDLVFAALPAGTGFSSASAGLTYTGESCIYDVVLTTLGETEGSSNYRLFVGDSLIGQFIPPASETDLQKGPEYTFRIPNIRISKGDEVILFFSNELSLGTTRAAWTGITFESPSCPGGTFIEEDGYLIIEMEDAPRLGAGWKVYPGEGSASDSYIQFDHTNSLGEPFPGSETKYQIQINNPGTYQFSWRSRNGFTAEAFDEENDSWIMIIADDYYGMKGGNKVSIAGEYVKFYIHSMDNWSFGGTGEINHETGYSLFADFEQPGTYEIRVAGRSAGHVIDRMALYMIENQSIAKNVFTPVSSRGCVTESDSIAFSMTAQKNGFAQGDSVILTIASDIDALESLELYQNGNRVKQTILSFFQHGTAPLLSGAYKFTAMASDTSGHEYETSLQIMIPPGESAPVLLLSLNYDMFYIGQMIKISANAYETDGGRIEEVNFYYDDEFNFRDVTPPYERSIRAREIGMHKVKVEALDNDGNLTSRSLNVEVFPGVSVEGYDAAKTVLYPVPAGDVLNFKCAFEVKEIRIYDSRGSLVLTKTINTESEGFLDCSSLEPGLYLVKIAGEGNEIMLNKFTKLP